MPRQVERRWEGDPGAEDGRRARGSFTNGAFIPPSLSRQIACALPHAERASIPGSPNAMCRTAAAFNDSAGRFLVAQGEVAGPAESPLA